MSSVDLRNTEEIYDEAFSGCSSLVQFDLKNVKKIYKNIFLECEALKTILINGNKNGQNNNYKVIDGKQVYDKSNNSLIVDLS